MCTHTHHIKFQFINHYKYERHNFYTQHDTVYYTLVVIPNKMCTFLDNDVQFLTMMHVLTDHVTPSSAEHTGESDQQCSINLPFVD